MCTAVTYRNGDHYFGRNLDLEYSFGEAVTITPQRYMFPFRYEQPIPYHYAMIGMAILKNNYPLYFDATNEYGLSMAGLNFPENAIYHAPQPNKHNIAPFEFVPWILGQCKDIHQAMTLLNSTVLVDVPFSNDIPLTPLHWIIADKNCAITVESVADGLKVYENPIGVLTNNPPFDFHMNNIKNYLNLTASEPTNRFSDKLGLCAYSRGMGAIGLPGDYSSSSRFIKAAFVKLNSISEKNEHSAVNQFFHILDSVCQVNGCVKIGNTFEKTIYSSCCNTVSCTYYYKTYNNNKISGVSLHRENLNSEKILQYPINDNDSIRIVN